MLLHLATTAQWRAHIAAGAIAPNGIEFVHLSSAEQVTLPAQRLFPERDDVSLLVLDPARIPVEIRYEPGVPGDPESMRFPHAYGPIPLDAVVAVEPYRPPFGIPVLPDRRSSFEPSLLRRVATTEIDVVGGVAVRTAPVPASRQHNQLLLDGPVDADTVIAEADRALAGLAHRAVLLAGQAMAAADGLTAHGWSVERLVDMAAPAGGSPDPRVDVVDIDAMRPFWTATWRSVPDITDAEIAQLVDRQALEEQVTDQRYLAVRERGEVVAGAVLRIDGATAQLDMVETWAEHRGRGHGDALVATAKALTPDLLVLNALTDDWPVAWYARRGFARVGERATAHRAG